MGYRARLQTDEVPVACRSNTNTHHGGGPELAVSPPDPHPADRRYLPGFPGIFPLRTLSRKRGAPVGGSSGSPSEPWSADCHASRWMPCCGPTRPLTNSSRIRRDGEKGKDSDARNAYPDAYGALPLGSPPRAVALGTIHFVRGTRGADTDVSTPRSAPLVPLAMDRFQRASPFAEGPGGKAP